MEHACTCLSRCSVYPQLIHSQTMRSKNIYGVPGSISVLIRRKQVKLSTSEQTAMQPLNALPLVMTGNSACRYTATVIRFNWCKPGGQVPGGLTVCQGVLPGSCWCESSRVLPVYQAGLSEVRVERCSETRRLLEAARRSVHQQEPPEPITAGHEWYSQLHRVWRQETVRKWYIVGKLIDFFL